MKLVSIFQEHESPIRKVFIFNDRERIMSLEANDVIHIWRAEDGETLVSLAGPNRVFNMSPNCKFAVSGDGSATYVAFK